MSDGTLADDDRGFLYGDGLFETVRIEDGTPWFVDRHRHRFRRSADALDFPSTTVEEVMAVFDDLEGREDGLWRVTATRPGDGVFGGGSGTVALRRRPLPTTDDELAVTILEGTYFPADRRAEHKTTSWMRYADAMRRARGRGYAEGLLVSPDGRVGEAAAANLFARIGGGWVTPPVEGILPGVVREHILAEAQKNGPAVEERPLFVGDLQTCESIALTSSGRLVSAVTALDNQPLETSPVEELEELVKP